jgi:hypothetical protein
MSIWKEDWDLARERLTAWWDCKGLALHVCAPKDEPWENITCPTAPDSVDEQWLDLDFRVQETLYHNSRTYFGGVAFPSMRTELGPGSLGTFLGSEPGFSTDTVWYHPCITDNDLDRKLEFDSEDRWFQVHLDILKACKKVSDGRCLVGFADLIENVDTLAQLRDAQTLLMDMIERPEWVSQKVAEINRVFFDSFDAMYELIKDEWCGSTFWAFSLWGLGKTAKVQCDTSAMFSPDMFKEFVVPALTEQCAWLDNSMYHLDGTQCIGHLDHLLEIEPLKAIEWTPQTGIEGGGDPRWYDMYRRIRQAGKSVQAIEVRFEEVLPLIDAVGPEGLYIMTSAPNENAARELVKKAYG